LANTGADWVLQGQGQTNIETQHFLSTGSYNYYHKENFNNLAEDPGGDRPLTPWPVRPWANNCVF